MERLKGAGCSVGQYIGDGQREVEAAVDSSCDSVDADPVVEHLESEEEDDCGSEDSNPLLIFYDCEMTGFSIYRDHITDIGAKVVASPVLLDKPTFSSLVRTPRTIPAAGKW